MSQPIIAVEGLGKKYLISHQQEGKARYHSLRETMVNGMRGVGRRLRRPFARLERQRREEFWALRDVSFEVQPGEVVGIIGRNGAGKSTLLKILSRITEPTTGQVTLRGRVASLLEVGTGFHPELSGRENVYLNGTILGMSRAEIRRKFDEIVAFAEVEKFLDTPVKRYSSGMYMRLAFAVAAHLEPEILIVDEVLAVGDVAFQQKCLGKMQAVSMHGRTVLFVSHNMQAVSSLCNRGIYLENGKVQYAGSVEEVIRRHLSSASEIRWANWSGDAGDKNVRLTATSAVGRADGTFRTDEPLRIRIKYQILQRIVGLVCAVEIFNQYQQRLVYSAIDDCETPPSGTVHPGTYHSELTIPANTFATGNYRIEFDIGIHNVHRIIQGTGTLAVRMENVTGIGRRLLAHDNVVRPDWQWKSIVGSA